ncbi:MAG: InlB B-repeat-containing protein [Lachnospiraceae bacterium]|nr:InlB B-repeat-containing protein [Lachnospiraceae bacterium]
MKKHFYQSIILCVSVMAIAIVCLCAESAKAAHTHSWYVQRVEREATCTSTGSRVMRCSCGAYKTETIPKKAHVGVKWVVVKDATCTTGGVREWQCSCGHALRGETFPASGHNWQLQSTVASTCATHGSKNYKCSKCKTTKSEALPLSDHVGLHWVTVVQPTCYSGGKEEWRCSYGHALNGRDIPTKPHSWVYDHTIPSTCTAYGSTVYRCSNSGCSATRTEGGTVPPTGHTYRWVVTSQPTETVNGVESNVCSYCDALNGTRALYLITYKPNGGKDAPAAQTKTQGTAITLSTGKPTRTGYTFRGWGTSADASTVTYYGGEEYSSNARLTLYAIWKIKTYSVIYNANGGSGVPGTQTKTYGKNLTLSSTVPHKDGFTFKGWATAADSTTVAYAPGSTYTKNAALKLYAVWEAITYDVVLLDPDGFVVATAKKTHGQGLSLQAFSDMIMPRYGYIVSGWAEMSNPTSVRWAANSTFTTDADTTLVAVLGVGNREFDNYDFSGYVRGSGLSKTDFIKGGSTNYGCNQGEYSLDPLILYWFDMSAKNCGVEIAPDDVKDILAGSCGIFAAVNTALYLKRLQTGQTSWTYEEVRDYVVDYLQKTNRVVDWIERTASGGDGPASICTALQAWFADRNCDAIWKPLSGDFASDVEKLLRKDIPVIVSFDGSTDYGGAGEPLGYYELNESTNRLERREAFVDGHYFVVTGVYLAPGNPYHFFEISTWGKKRFICYEEYLAKKGSAVFSTYLELKFS